MFDNYYTMRAEKGNPTKGNNRMNLRKEIRRLSTGGYEVLIYSHNQIIRRYECMTLEEAKRCE